MGINIPALAKNDLIGASLGILRYTNRSLFDLVCNPDIFARREVLTLWQLEN
jgi:hypothetical protein